MVTTSTSTTTNSDSPSSTPGMTVKEVVEATKKAFAPATDIQKAQAARAKAKGGLTSSGIAKFEKGVSEVAEQSGVSKDVVREELLQQAERRSGLRAETVIERQARLVKTLEQHGKFDTDTEAFEAIALKTGKSVVVSPEQLNKIQKTTGSNKQILSAMTTGVIQAKEKPVKEYVSIINPNQKTNIKTTIVTGLEAIDLLKQRGQEVPYTESYKQQLETEEQRLKKEKLLGDKNDIIIRVGRKVNISNTIFDLPYTGGESYNKKTTTEKIKEYGTKSIELLALTSKKTADAPISFIKDIKTKGVKKAAKLFGVNFLDIPKTVVKDVSTIIMATPKFYSYTPSITELAELARTGSGSAYTKMLLSKQLQKETYPSIIRITALAAFAFTPAKLAEPLLGAAIASEGIKFISSPTIEQAGRATFITSTPLVASGIKWFFKPKATITGQKIRTIETKVSGSKTTKITGTGKIQTELRSPFEKLIGRGKRIESKIDFEAVSVGNKKIFELSKGSITPTKITTLQKGVEFTPPKFKLVSPSEKAFELSGRGKLLYKPSTEQSVLLSEFTRGQISINMPGTTPPSVSIMKISKQLAPQTFEEVVSHELIHYFTPKKILFSGLDKPYRKQPAEILAFGLMKPLSVIGFPVLTKGEFFTKTFVTTEKLSEQPVFFKGAGKQEKGIIKTRLKLLDKDKVTTEILTKGKKTIKGQQSTITQIEKEVIPTTPEYFPKDIIKGFENGKFVSGTKIISKPIKTIISPEGTWTSKFFEQTGVQVPKDTLLKLLNTKTKITFDKPSIRKPVQKKTNIPSTKFNFQDGQATTQIIKPQQSEFKLGGLETLTKKAIEERFVLKTKLTPLVELPIKKVKLDTSLQLKSDTDLVKKQFFTYKQKSISKKINKLQSPIKIKTYTETIDKQLIQPSLKQESSVKLDDVLKLTQSPVQINKPVQTTKQITSVKSVLEIPTIITTTILKTSPKLKLETKNLITKQPKQQGYDVMVKRVLEKKRKGKYVSRGYKKVNKKPLTKDSALGLGADIVDRYTNRTFKIKQTNKSGIKNQRYNNAWAMKKNKFRTGKRSKKLYVEKTTHAIDSFQEKQGIPYKAARLRKAGMFKSKKNNMFKL